MIRDIIAKKINCVVVYKLDRLIRSLREFYTLNDLFIEYKVHFVCTDFNIDTSTAVGNLGLNMLLSVAQFERDIASDRIRDKLQQRAQKGMWHGGTLPYGYGNVDKKLIINHQEAERLRFIYQMYSQNPSVSHVRQELHLRGWYNRKGKLWNKTYLYKMLKNKLYIGLIKHNEVYYKGIHKPIISKELFEQVQSLLPNRSHVKSKINRTYLLKGLLKCGSCYSFMTPHYTRKTRKDGSKYNIPYYRCTKKTHHSYDACSTKSLNAENIEKQVVDYISKLSRKESLLNAIEKELNQEQSRSIKPVQEEKQLIEKRIADINSQIDNLIEALGKGKVSIEFIEQAIGEKKEEKEKLDEKLSTINRNIKENLFRPYDINPLKESIFNLNTIFNHLTPKEKSEALQCMVKDIEVHSDQLVLNLYELLDVYDGSQKRSFWWS